MIREVDDQQGVSALIADLGISGVWQPQTEALFDTHVNDTDTQSYIQHSFDAFLNSAEEEKRRKYSQAMKHHAHLFLH